LLKEKFVKTQKVLRLATIDSKGMPHLVPVWYKYVGKKFYIGTNTKTAKARNISKNNKVCFCIDVGVWHPIDGVMGIGKARLIKDEKIVKNCRPDFTALFQIIKAKICKRLARKYRLCNRDNTRKGH